MRRIFTSDEVNLAINLYNNGKQQWEIGEQLNCAQTTISLILRENNVKTRIGKKIIYNDINTEFFKKINNEANAYFLGFLYADGCVQIKNNAYCVTLKLKSDDIAILEKFRDIMSPSSSIKITSGKYSYFRINRKEICDQLIALGCVPNKSLILKFPTQIPNNLINHFLRGYSDGDGTIYNNTFKKKKYINTIWKFISTKQFCEEAGNILKKELGINCWTRLACPESNKITTTLIVGGNNQVKKALDWLYKDATIYLSRKYEKYLEFTERKSHQPYREFKRLNFSAEDKDNITQLYLNGMTSYEVAQQYGVSKPSILNILHENNVKLRPNAIQISSSKSFS